MLITSKEIRHAINLSDIEVTLAMAMGGYTGKFHDTVFIGMNPGLVFVYEHTYDDFESGEIAIGRVYLRYIDGNLFGEY